MATLLLFTPSTSTSSQVLPALSLVDHTVRVLPASASAAAQAPEADLWLLDAQHNLVAAKTLC
ncbi:MAG TPA: DNA-binding response regulator, partial [Candidatus Avipropionibacterium avicola]|nr:DNA-binding response regulator [Candidatus Avipropionibacterium avicola]